MTFDNFTDLERRAVVLARCYETVRQSHQQHGYRIFTKLNEEVRSEPIFKQLLKTVEWFDAQGFNVTANEQAWVGLVKFAFKYLSPTIPQPSQLKNKLLLWKYLESSNFTTDDTPLRTDDDLRDLYAKILHKDVKDSPALMRSMGIKFRKEIECISH